MASSEQKHYHHSVMTVFFCKPTSMNEYPSSFSSSLMLVQRMHHPYVLCPWSAVDNHSSMLRLFRLSPSIKTTYLDVPAPTAHPLSFSLLTSKQDVVRYTSDWPRVSGSLIRSIAVVRLSWRHRLTTDQLSALRWSEMSTRDISVKVSSLWCWPVSLEWRSQKRCERSET